MTQLLCFVFGVNCIFEGWVWTGLLLLYIALCKDVE